MSKKLAVLVIIETDDPLLDPENLNVSTRGAAAELRAAVIRNLPNLTRVVMVTPEPMAEVMLAAHEVGMEAIGQADSIVRPPKEETRH